jgi:hypothetical protein
MNHLIKQVPDNCALFLPETLVRSTDICGTQSQGKQFTVSPQVLGEGIRTLKKTTSAQKIIPPPGRPQCMQLVFIVASFNISMAPAILITFYLPLCMLVS